MQGCRGARKCRGAEEAGGAGVLGEGWRRRKRRRWRGEDDGAPNGAGGEGKVKIRLLKMHEVAKLMKFYSV